MTRGTIIRGVGGFYYVKTDTDAYECKVRGIFRKENITPLVGDHVRIQVIDEKKLKGHLTSIEERKNQLIRPKAANIDQVIIVMAAKSPDLNRDMLDRLIILAENEKIEILILINKIDLDTKKEYIEVEEIYKKNFTVLTASVKENVHINELRPYLENKVSIFAGPSGAGKSSFINALDTKFNLKTGSLSAKIGRGKHTTRHTELLAISNNSFIADTPGFTSIHLQHISENDLADLFREFRPFAGRCRFAGCRHVDEPDCAIKNEIGGPIDRYRYNSYLRIWKELKEGS